MGGPTTEQTIQKTVTATAPQPQAWPVDGRLAPAPMPHYTMSRQSAGGTAQTADLISALNYVALNAEKPGVISMSVIVDTTFGASSE